MVHDRISTVGQEVREKPRRRGNSPKFEGQCGSLVQPSKKGKEEKGRRNRAVKRGEELGMREDGKGDSREWGWGEGSSLCSWSESEHKKSYHLSFVSHVARVDS
jgi:hypothetical protein